MSGQDFSEEQKRYLEGFVTGVRASRSSAGQTKALAETTNPDAAHLAAMARYEAAGKKLSNEEKAKREEHPFDAYARLKSEAAKSAFPKGADNFRWRFHGLFYAAPNQDAFMCRIRVANGILTHWQLAAIADLAKTRGGGYAHVTTRAGLQIREIKAADGPPVIETLTDLGLVSKGAGADNIRNVTGSPTAGIDPQELIDTRPFAKAWHHHILNDRSLHGLPRKFNVGFDGGGLIPVLEDTNDIAFTAVVVARGQSPDRGHAKKNTVTGGQQSGPEQAGTVRFQLGLGGITGHKDFARPTGVLIEPAEVVAVADAIVRVFIDRGDRTDRKKARLKYVLDAMGFDSFLAEVEAKLGRALTRIPLEQIAAPNRQQRQFHVGAHRQRQPGVVWVGVVLPVGKMTAEQMLGLAAIAREMGDGDIRLTVWQNLLISGVAAERAWEVETRLQAIGLTSSASSIRAGLVACTGNVGCKFASSDTKGTALAIADWVEARVALDTPINIHLTGCPNSCAQHYIGDLGLLACRVPLTGSDDTVEGFHVFAGGGFGAEQSLGRELYQNVCSEHCPVLVERILKAYLANRAGADETFVAFARRHDIPALKSMVEAQGGAP